MQYIRMLRQRQGLTQAEVATKVGCDQSLISRAEQQGHVDSWSIHDVRQLAKVYDMPVEYLFNAHSLPMRLRLAAQRSALQWLQVSDIHHIPTVLACADHELRQAQPTAVQVMLYIYWRTDWLYFTVHQSRQQPPRTLYPPYEGIAQKVVEMYVQHTHGMLKTGQGWAMYRLIRDGVVGVRLNAVPEDVAACQHGMDIWANLADQGLRATVMTADRIDRFYGEQHRQTMQKKWEVGTTPPPILPGDTKTM